ncbi:Hypothetical predicted protein [Paramuricea clavata]|uniref:Uncharacterized protein n=1 Tax=Paramuricea clavata TaxID=317549 RepID=A0A7D9HL51_PARCT|nr:Hypothetical predicted protein [Paramuricea clavata]
MLQCVNDKNTSLRVTSRSLTLRLVSIFYATVGDRIIGRWTNNKYLSGKIASISEEDISILFDDGTTITHPLNHVTAVFADTVPVSVNYKDHVVAAWQGSYKQYIGYVIEVSESQGFKVRFEDNDGAWYQKNQLRIFSNAATVYDG